MYNQSINNSCPSSSKLHKLTKAELVSILLNINEDVHEYTEFSKFKQISKDFDGNDRNFVEYIMTLEKQNQGLQEEIKKHKQEFNRLLDLIQGVKTTKQLKLLQKLGRLDID